MITPSNKLTTVIKRIKRSTKPTTGYNNSLRLSHNVILLAAMLGMASVRGMHSSGTPRSSASRTSLSSLSEESVRSMDRPMNEFQDHVRTLTGPSIDTSGNMDEIISIQESLAQRVISLEETQAKLTYLRTITQPRLDLERKAYEAQVKSQKDANYKKREGGYNYKTMLRNERNNKKKKDREMYDAAVAGEYEPLHSDGTLIVLSSEDSSDRKLQAHRPEGLGKVGGFFSGKNWTTVEQERLGFAEKCTNCGDAGTVTPKSKAECTIGATPYTFGWFSHIGHLCSMPCPVCATHTHKVFLTQHVYDEKARGGYYPQGSECTLKAIDNKWFNRTPQATIKMNDGRTITVDSTKLENELDNNRRISSQHRPMERRGSFSRQNSSQRQRSRSPSRLSLLQSHN